jgi:hypothetical protein
MRLIEYPGKIVAGDIIWEGQNLLAKQKKNEEYSWK